VDAGSPAAIDVLAVDSGAMVVAVVAGTVVVVAGMVDVVSGLPTASRALHDAVLNVVVGGVDWWLASVKTETTMTTSVAMTVRGVNALDDTSGRVG
jgi:hypothetical protein